MQVKPIPGLLQDITGFDIRWPVGGPIIALILLVANIVDLFLPINDDLRIQLSYIIPSSIFVPLIILVYVPGFWWNSMRQ